jgi:hypothetical protein
MRNTFEILARFLRRSEGEVEGRELQEPTDETKAKLQRLARGTLPEPEQPVLFAELNRHPEWVNWLAREIKTLRTAQS